MRHLLLTTIVIVSLIFLNCGQDGRDFDTLAKAGMDAYDRADYNEAVSLFNKALHLKPSDRDMLYQIGLTFERLDLADSALVYLHRADILYPADYDVNKELFRLCSNTEDYECALSAIRMLIANGDSEEMFWIPLADLNYFIGNYRLAVMYYKLLIDEDPKEGRYRWNLSDCLAKMNKPEESNEVLEKAVKELGPNPVAYSQIAINYVTMQKHALAEEYFRKAIKFDPKNVSLWINLANVLTEQDSREKKEEGLEIYRRYYIDTPEMFKIDSLIKALEKELGED